MLAILKYICENALRVIISLLKAMFINGEEQRITPYEGRQLLLSGEGRDSTLCFDKVRIALIIFFHCSGELSYRHHLHIVVVFDFLLAKI